MYTMWELFAWRKLLFYASHGKQNVYIIGVQPVGKKIEEPKEKWSKVETDNTEDVEISESEPQTNIAHPNLQ